MPSIGFWKAKKYLDNYCLYGRLFLLPAIVFLLLFVGFKFCFFLLLLVNCDYSVIKIIYVKYISLCNFHLLFHIKATNNSILPQNTFFHFRITSNPIPLYSQQSRACSISILTAANNIFLIGVMNKVIEPVAKYVRYLHNLFL